MCNNSQRQNILSVDANGDYVISYNMEQQDIKAFDAIKSDAFAFNVNGSKVQTQGLGGVTNIPANTPLYYDPNDLEVLQAAFVYMGYSSIDVTLLQAEDFLTQKQTLDLDADFTINSFPKEVAAIKNAKLQGYMDLNVLLEDIPFEYLTMSAGTTITFPTFMHFSGCSNNNFTLNANGNVLTAKNDVKIYIGSGEGKGLKLNLTLDQLDFGSNGIAPNAQAQLPLPGKLQIDGELALDPLTFTGPKKDINYPSDLTNPTNLDKTVTVVESDTPVQDLKFSYNYAAAITALNEITLKISDSAKPQFDKTYGFDIEGLDDNPLFNGSDVAVELADLQVMLSVDSSLPIDFDLNATLKPLKEGNPTSAKGAPYQLGPLSIAKSAKTTYCLNETKEGLDAGVNYKKVAGLGSILNPVPDRLEATDFDVTLDNGWLTFATTTENIPYGAKLDVGLNAPLAFTANTHLSMPLDIEMKIDLTSMGANLPELHAILSFTAANTIPLSFGIDAQAIDSDKKPIEGIRSEVKGTIAAGAIGKPSSNPVSIDLTLDPGKVVSGIRLALSASSTEELAGTRMNQNQGLTLTDVSIELPDGITADINSILKK